MTAVWISELFFSENFGHNQYLQVHRPTGAGLVAETVKTQRKVWSEILSKTESGHVI